MNLQDERITKYILGEMSSEEKQQFEQLMESDQDLKNAVNDLKSFTHVLSEGLKEEPLPAALPIKEFKTMKAKLKNILSIVIPVGATACIATIIYLNTQNQETYEAINMGQSHKNEVPRRSDDIRANAKNKNRGRGRVESRAINRPKERQAFSRRLPDIPSPPTGSLSREQLLRLAEKEARESHNTTASSISLHNSVPDDYQQNFPPQTADKYDHLVENEFKSALEDPLSTFSIDVDTASYSNIRRYLDRGQRPPAAAVRIEEMVNYFNYDYPVPKDDRPFSVHMELIKAPWNKKHNLLRIGLKGREIDWSEKKNSNLVFLLDVSGSMSGPNRLPLVKQGLKLLLENLGSKDRIAIVVYAGSSGLVLPSTPASNKEEILAALDRLSAGGSTNGGAGIELAYKIAQDNFIKGGVNRVLLATDGDFNVGTTSRQSLVELIQTKAKSNVFLTVLGFGTGNLQDSQMEALANKGNGNYAYIDSYKEAKKVLVEEVGGTLVTIAKDVKIQVEFNPALVSNYRLIGYENRLLQASDFNDDKIDAGEIGAGHTVTAFYEIVPSGVSLDNPKVDELKYQKKKAVKKPKKLNIEKLNDEWLTVKLRYKEPEGDRSRKIEFPLKGKVKEFSQISKETRFATSVVGFGMLLKQSKYNGKKNFDEVIKWAESSRGRDKKGYRQEFIDLVKKAQKLYQR